jgi:hypothetical protein
MDSSSATQENAMQQFIEKFRDKIAGWLSVCDRLVFRGCLRRLQYATWNAQLNAMVAVGMEQYLWQQHILFKDYFVHVKQASERIKQSTQEVFKQQNLPVIYLPSPSTDKEAVARQVATEKKIESGWVCAISSLEPSPTFEHRGHHIIRRIRPCHMLYHYQIHPQIGWMHARIQTWFPFNIQVAVNGREWLSRQMDQTGLKYRKQGNCFVWIEDYAQAQKLMDQQLETDWSALLNAFAAQLNPHHDSLFELYRTDYYWTAYQTEQASDIVFRQADDLNRLMPLLVRHSLLNFYSPDVMRYFGRKVNQSGAIPAHFSGSLESDLKRRQEGERVKFRMNSNSVKFYDKAKNEMGGLLRVETTINRVSDFRVYRPKEGGPEDDFQWRTMRKGISDLHRRAEVSQKTNDRLLDALASVDDSRTLEELTAEIQKPVGRKQRRMRGLRPWAEDKSLLAAINHGEFLINGLRNRDLQALLYTTEATSPAERRRRSAAISRKLRLLKAHRLIQKVPRTHRYLVTEAGRAILLAVLTSARTSVHQLNQLKEAA